MTSSPMPAARCQHLLDLLALVPDPRKKRGRRHALAGLLAVGIAAVIAGSRSFAATGQWAGDAGPDMLAALGAERGPAEESTYRRAFAVPISVSGVALSPDGKTLATAGRDGTARLWDVSTGAQVRPPIIVPGGVSGVALSPNGDLLATADGDGTARLWDVSTGAQVGTPLTVPSDGVVLGVAFSPDGKTLATSGLDRTVRLWDVAFPANLVDAVCRIAGRSLTRQEWSTYIPSEPFQQVCPAR